MLSSCVLQMEIEKGLRPQFWPNIRGEWIPLEYEIGARIPKPAGRGGNNHSAR